MRVTTCQLVLVPLLLVASPVAAQVTSPAGYLNKEGPQGTPLRSFQVIEAGHIGKTLNLRSFALRRDNRLRSSGGKLGGATLRLGLGWPQGRKQVTHVWSQNYLGTPTTVFRNNKIQLPDWSNKVKAPAPFDFVLNFSSPFRYAGSVPMVWDLTVANGGGHITDRSDGAMGGWHLPGGPGCRTASDASGSAFNLLTLVQSAPRNKFFGLGVSIWGAAKGGDKNVAGQSVLAAIGLSTANIKIPGWCAPIRVAPDQIVALGKLDNNANLGLRGLVVNYDAAAITRSVHVQLATTNTKGQVILSNAYGGRFQYSTKPRVDTAVLLGSSAFGFGYAPIARFQ